MATWHEGVRINRLGNLGYLGVIWRHHTIHSLFFRPGAFVGQQFAAELLAEALWKGIFFQGTACIIMKAKADGDGRGAVQRPPSPGPRHPHPDPLLFQPPQP